MSPEIDPTVDFAFKRLFGTPSNAALLVDLLNAVVTGPLVREVTLLNPFTEKEFENDKQAIFDIRAKDQAGRPFLLEMQKLVPWFFPKRILFNWAGAYAEQLQKGDYHATLVPTVVLCILTQNRFEDDEVHHVFRMVDAERNILFCKDAEIHTIELSKFRSEAEQVATPIERWCYFLTHAMEMDPKALPEQLETPAIIQAMEVLMRIRESEQDRQAYLARRQNDADIATREYVNTHAQELGEIKGRIGQIQFAQRVLKQPVTAREELERFTLADLTALADRLERQALPPDDAP